MSWRTKTLIREALLNVACSTWRTVGLTVATGIVFGALATLELRDANELRTFQDSYVTSGGYVALGVPAPGGSAAAAARCESLNSNPGVVAAGAQGPGELVSFASAPRVLFQRVRISPGIVEVWGRTRLPSAEATHLVIGDALAAELGLRERSFATVSGERPAPVGLILDTSRRNLQVGRWVFDIAPPEGPVESCWVEFEPAAFEAGMAALPALFTSGDEAATARPYFRRDEFTRDPGADFVARPQRNGWPVASVLVAGVLALASWFRRAEMGLYLALGTRRTALTLMLCVESGIVILAATALGTAYAFAIDGALRHEAGAPELILVLRTTGSAALLAMAVGPLLASVLVRGNIADLLKER